MADFRVGLIDNNDIDEEDEAGTRERRISLQKKRHYKKDSRFLYDLYTLTFDENETVDGIATCNVLMDEEQLFKSFSTPSSPTPSRANSMTYPSKPKVSAPMSLNYVSYPRPRSSVLTRKTIPSLETNLHKILARKFLDSEEVSFKKAKLLTKAYYKLLRTNSIDGIATSEIQDTFQSLSFHSVGHKRSNHNLLRSVSSK